MTQFFRAALAALTALALTAPAALAAPVDDLHALFEEVEAFDVSENPIEAGRKGDIEALGQMPVVTPEAEARRAEANEAFLEQLEAIDRAALPEEERLNYDLMEWMLERRIMLAGYDTDRIPFVNDSGFHTMLSGMARQTRLNTAEEAEAWISRLNDYPRYMDESIANLERAIETGWVQPRMIAERVLENAEAQVPAEDAADSAFYLPLTKMPNTIPAERQEALKQQAVLAINESVRPATIQLVEFLENAYLPASRESLGAREMPGGEAYYPALVEYFTTTDLTPQQIHQIGLSEVERIRGEMDAVIAETGFEGTFEDFLNYLRTDPQFYAETPKELLQAASYYAKKADDQMPAFFKTLPRNSYGVRPVPEDIAPNYTTGRYWGGDYENGVAGGYMVNTYNLKQRPLYNIPSLTVHEAVPGHHHQIALSNELEGLPEFRKGLYPTAFGEGWGLYTEKLAVEMGIYETPYEHFGRLSYEMWRACRLVVDTGIHWYGWTRDEAEACFLENSALAEHNIRTEVDRYISWPGQALAYKIGELKLWELRERAEDALGADFDIREFHDAVLVEGGMPLGLLEEKIDRWIAEQQAGDDEG